MPKREIASKCDVGAKKMRWEDEEEERRKKEEKQKEDLEKTIEAATRKKKQIEMERKPVSEEKSDSEKKDEKKKKDEEASTRKKKQTEVGRETVSEEKAEKQKNDQEGKKKDEKEKYEIRQLKKDDDPFLSWVRTTHCREDKATEVIIQRVPLNEDEEVFTFSYLETMQNQHRGIFSQRHTNRGTVQYFCERHVKPRGKKRGPLETRANNCPAYLSFRFITHQGKKAAIIRRKLTHDGHNPLEIAEKRVARLNRSLVAYVETLLDQGKKPGSILTSCAKWARSRGRTDVRDREYFPTPIDIKNLSRSFKDKCRKHKNDAVTVEYPCTTLLKDDIVDYQPLNNYLEDLAKAGRLKNVRHVKKRRGTRMAKKMPQAGQDKLIVWETGSKCRVPSQQQNSMVYHVDIVKALCDCPAASQGGLCEHFHLAVSTAGQRNVEVDELRRQIAEKIFSSGNYLCDNDKLQLLDDDGEVSIVNMQNYACTCKAYSHGVKCVCVRVAELLAVERNAPTVLEICYEIPTDDLAPSTVDNIRHKINEIHDWANSEGLGSCTNLNEVLDNVNRLHTSILGNFKTSTSSSGDHLYTAVADTQLVSTLDMNFREEWKF